MCCPQITRINTEAMGSTKKLHRFLREAQIICVNLWTKKDGMMRRCVVTARHYAAWSF
jgi:hypothetical protein